MARTKIYIETSPSGTEYMHFKHKGKKVAIFENVLGEWVASGFCRQYEAPTMEEAIAEYKKHAK